LPLLCASHSAASATYTTVFVLHYRHTYTRYTLS
jgi:hypothetical protein